MNAIETVNEHNANRKKGEPFAFVCESCGKATLRAPGRRKKRCFSCNIDRMQDAIIQQQRKSGPIYELSRNRWITGMRVYLDSIESDA